MHRGYPRHAAHPALAIGALIGHTEASGQGVYLGGSRTRGWLPRLGFVSPPGLKGWQLLSYPTFRPIIVMALEEVVNASS